MYALLSEESSLVKEIWSKNTHTVQIREISCFLVLNYLYIFSEDLGNGLPTFQRPNPRLCVTLDIK